MKSNVKWIQYSSFAAAGVAGNLISPLLPYIRKDLNMTYGQSGILISEPFIGMLIVGLLGSYIINKYGNKRFLIAGGISLFLGFLGTLISTSYEVLFFMNFITVVGFGIYEVGVNTLCADYSTTERGNDMNLLHFFYGLGAIFSSVLALICTNYLGIWRLSFAIALILPIVSIYFLIPFKEKGKSFIQKENNACLKKVKATPLKSLLLWIAGFTTFIYVGIEVSTSGWIPEFWKSIGKDNLMDPSLATGLFWVSMTLGRLITGRIADKIGLLKFILVASVGTSAISLSWVAFPPGIWTIISILIIGFFLSGLYPTIMAFATSIFPHDTGTVAAFIAVLGSIGGVIIPIFIGKVSDSFGIVVLPICIFIFSVVFTALNLLWCLYKNYRQAKAFSLGRDA